MLQSSHINQLFAVSLLHINLNNDEYAALQISTITEV